MIDSITVNIESKDLDSLYKANISQSRIKKGEFFTIDKLILERDRLIKLFKNNGIYNFQQRSINYQVLIDSTGNIKKIPIILNVKNIDQETDYQIKKIDNINIFVESLDELSNIDSYTDSINYNGINIFSKGKLNYYAKSLIEPIFFNISDSWFFLTGRRCRKQMPDFLPRRW